MDQLEDAYVELQLAIDLAREIKHPHLLVVDASRMVDFLEQANDRVEHEGLDQLLQRVRQFKPSIAEEMPTAPVPEERAPVIEVKALGSDSVRVDGETIVHTHWKGPLVKELFFYLLENEPVRREVILDVFWPDYSTAKAQSVFHASLYRMRRILPKGLIRYDNEEGVYVIEKGIEYWYDARAFTNLLERADTEADPEEMLEQALTLYQGDYLPSVYSSWCLEQRSMYQGMFIRALTRLAALKADKEQYDKAAECYRRAVDLEPYQEELHRGLMWALSNDGRQIEALQQYEQLAALLKVEFDLTPAVETKALFDQIQQRAKFSG
jgi:two-component system LytT family response regulator